MRAEISTRYCLRRSDSSEHKQKVLPTVLSNSLDLAFQATSLAQLQAEQLETWSRARRRISHRRFALNIKRMLEDDECHKLTSLPKELLVKPAKEEKEQSSHLCIEAEDPRIDLCFAKRWILTSFLNLEKAQNLI